MKRRIPHFKLKLTKGVKEDLETWEKFFVKYNAITMFLPNEPELDKDLNLETAVPTIGFGLVYGNKWTYRVWPEEWLSFQETTREVFSILLIIKLFGTELRNRRLKLHKGDHKRVKIINIQSVKDPNTTVLIRNMVLSLMLHNIQLTATTTTDMSNHLAVLLSNQQVQEFMQTNPTARKQPEIIPADPQPKKVHNHLQCLLESTKVYKKACQVFQDFCISTDQRRVFPDLIRKGGSICVLSRYKALFHSNNQDIPIHVIIHAKRGYGTSGMVHYGFPSVC